MTRKMKGRLRRYEGQLICFGKALRVIDRLAQIDWRPVDGNAVKSQTRGFSWHQAEFTLRLACKVFGRRLWKESEK